MNAFLEPFKDLFIVKIILAIVLFFYSLSSTAQNETLEIPKYKPQDKVLYEKIVQLDSIYFRGKAVSLEVKPGNKKLFIGRILYPPSNKFDRKLSKESLNEYNNKAPIIEINTFYNLEQDECVVTYESRGEIKYYKITNMVEKRRHDVPMTSMATKN